MKRVGPIGGNFAERSDGHCLRAGARSATAAAFDAAINCQRGQQAGLGDRSHSGVLAAPHLGDDVGLPG